MLIGLPGSGKSTWRAANEHKFSSIESAVVISSDDLIEKFGRENGLNYSEAFKTVDQKEIEKQVRSQFLLAHQDEADIIIDRTNMSKKVRRSWLSGLPKTYDCTAVVFQVEPEALAERLTRRHEATGKFIPPVVVESMRNAYEEPVLSEGFNTIKLFLQAQS